MNLSIARNLGSTEDLVGEGKRSHFERPSPERSLPETLLIDKDPVHAERVIRRLAGRKLRLQLVQNVAHAEAELRRSTYELVIINVSDPGQPWVAIVGRLQHACRESGKSWQPLILCVSTRQWEPHFELEIERKGARYVFER